MKMGIFGLNVKKMVAKKDVKGLIKALKHRNRWVRKDAAGALGNIKDARAVKPLTMALYNDLDGDVRRSTSRGFGEN